MKRFLAIAFISLVIVQLCLLPMAVQAYVINCPSVSTLAATDITGSTATLNGTASIPSLCSILKPDGVVLASLQYATPGTYAHVSFEYGTAPGVYSSSTPPFAMPQSGAFQATISGLTPCTVYYYRTRVTGTPPCKFDQERFGLQGAGVGLDYKNLKQIVNGNGCDDSYGSEMSFQTTGCIPVEPFVSTGGPTSHGSSFSGSITTTPPITNAVIQTQSASLSAKTVTPGTPVTVTADIINKSTVNGNKKVTLYVNGQVETTQGVNVNSGSTSKLTFNVSRSEPGDYTVYVDGVPAGSFKVEMVTGNDSILIFSAVLIALAFIAGMFMLWRRQRSV